MALPVQFVTSGIDPKLSTMLSFHFIHSSNNEFPIKVSNFETRLSAALPNARAAFGTSAAQCKHSRPLPLLSC